MLADLLKSSKDKLLDAPRSPFLGTFALIWLIRNWDLVYPLFIFDEGLNWEIKVQYVREYFTQGKGRFIGGVLINSLWTLGALSVTYFFMNMSRVITIMFEKRLRPWLTYQFDNSLVVLRADFDRANERANKYIVLAEKERGEKEALRKRNEELELSLNQANTITDDIIAEDEEVSPLSERLRSSLDYLVKNGLVAEFQSVYFAIDKYRMVLHSDDVQQFLFQRLIEKDTRVKETNEGAYYILTDFGEHAREKLRSDASYLALSNANLKG